MDQSVSENIPDVPWTEPDSRSIGTGLPRTAWTGRWWGYLLVENDGGTATKIPAIAVGSGSHPTVMVAAGIHGDEYEGAEAARRVCMSLAPTQMHGTIIALLAANPYAHRARSRTTPPELDGADLARTFPGDAGGSPTERLAAQLWDFLRGELDVDGIVVDLHSGGSHYAYTQLAGYRRTGGNVQDRSRELAQAVGFQRIWAMDPTPGTLSTEAALAGIPSVGCEVRGGAGLRMTDVAAYQSALHNLLRAVGVIPGEPVTNDVPLIHRRTTTLFTPIDGFGFQLPELGRAIAQDEQIAAVRDLIGHRHQAITSPHAGEIWATRTCPALQDGDIVALVSQPVDYADKTQTRSEP